ncbi:MAG: TPM domain-containing protein [Lachnospiraceae bacterium]|nr:TPM domain-containing protein [Lachnospiraceae bacterium]
MNKRTVKQFIKSNIVLAVIVLIVFGYYMYKKPSIPRKSDEVTEYVSGNTERVYGDKRVFDYGEALTDKEEEDLEFYIHEVEKEIGNDIVIVTLNESLKEYAEDYCKRYNMEMVSPDKYVMLYADEFWEVNKFGFDRPQILDGTQNTGDGVILVDNLFREPETGRIYTWMGTTGQAELRYSSDEIDHALDVFYDNLDEDYKHGLMSFVTQVSYDLDTEIVDLAFKPFAIIVAGFVLLIFVLTHLKSKSGKVTTTANTYVSPGGAKFVVHEDRFLRKSVSKVYDPPSSSSSSGGGGGHHTSGGGGSHGGGGHSR